jgi:hypothetical protein
MSLYAPDAVLDTGPLAMGTFEGQTAIRSFYEDWSGAYDDFQFEAEEIEDLDSGVILFGGLQRGRPRDSTGWAQVRTGYVVTWRNGLVERVTNYSDIDEARAAAERLAEERG